MNDDQRGGLPSEDSYLCETRSMSRIEGIDPTAAAGKVKAAFDAQERKWGAPLLPHLVHARRPTIYRGVSAMWAGLAASGLVDGKLRALLNRRVAALNGCEF